MIPELRVDVGAACMSVSAAYGPKDEDWDTAWLAELDRRVASAKADGTADTSEWGDVRSRSHSMKSLLISLAATALENLLKA